MEVSPGRIQAGLFIAGLLIFALFIPDSGPVRWLAMMGLALSCFALYREVLQTGQARQIWDSYNRSDELKYLLMSGGLVLGIGVGILYRSSLGMSMIPLAFTGFALVAAAIGATEELLFRGALVYLLRRQSVFAIIIITSMAHAGYKAMLFMSPFAAQSVDVVTLFSYTLIAGFILGSLRILSSSTAPPLVAPGLWDVVVYGDSLQPPWWVW